MEVTVTLGMNDYVAGTEENPRTLFDLVLDAAAREVLREVDKDARAKLRVDVGRITDEVIREQVEPLIAEALAGDVEPVMGGRRVPLRQHIVDVAKKALKWNEGRFENDRSMLANLVRYEVNQALERELRAELDEAKAKVREAVEARGAAFLADTAEMLAGQR